MSSGQKLGVPTSQMHRPVTNLPSWFPAGSLPPSTQPDLEHVEEFRSRQAQLNEELRAAGLDAVVTVKQSNLRYLTGYSTVAAGKAALAVTREGAFLAVSSSELGRAVTAPAVDGIHVFEWDEPVDIDKWLQECDATRDCRLIVCDWDGSVRGGQDDVGARRSLQARSEIIDRLRFVTSDWAASRVRRAGLATKAGIEAALSEASRSGAIDSDIGAAAMAAMVRDSGYECPAIVVVGIDEGGGIPHSQWQRRTLKPGGVAFLELSGGFEGYAAPVMRTIVREPVDADIIFLFDRVEEILNTLYNEIKPGARCSDIAAKCSAELPADDGILFHDNYGYPVSVFDDKTTWMNGPDFYIAAGNDNTLEPGMTFHLPIVLVRFGRYAVGQSQTIRVVDGGMEVLTDQVPTGLLRVAT